MYPKVHARNTLHTLLALLALTLLLAQSSQAQILSEYHYDVSSFHMAFTVQDGAETIDIEGHFKISPDTLNTTQGGYDTDADTDIVFHGSLSATSTAGRFALQPGRPLSRCTTGTLKEATTESEGGRIRVQRCSDEDGPLTLSPPRFDFSGGSPETIDHGTAQVIIYTGLEKQGPCYGAEEASFSLCVEASR